ncbi:hypothetical protein RSOLAG22IIIB_07379 [Rhizoctonia solani]|uniref:CHAT domain-containing protein n=1 Tax=Rhizoctonia solani TaxID=456999 RepID=A0A0K6FM85_9AGAM|nr:hypothetical protein RSOLAG22IIIB_07379 [Rhizoctonia solani]
MDQPAQQTLQEIDEEIKAFSLLCSEDLDDPLILNCLATAHTRRFDLRHGLEDIQTAIKYASAGLALAPTDEWILEDLLRSLGTALGERFQLLGDLDDIEKSIEYKSRALGMTPDDDSYLPLHLANLAISCKTRFEQLGEPGDIMRRSSVTLEQCLSELHDLEKAIQYASRALVVIPDGHPELSSSLANLGACHIYRFQRLGEPDDIERGLKYASRALELTPDGHPHLLRRLATLGAAYSDRFRLVSGKLVDLEKAIEYESRALAKITEDDPNYCVCHFNLALSYIDYHQHSNNPIFLKKSLAHFRIACSSVAGSPRDKFKHAYRWATHASKCTPLDPIQAYQTTIDLLPQFIWLGSTTDQRYQDLRTVENLALNAAHAAILFSGPALALEWLEHARCIVWNQNLTLRSPLDQLQDSHPILAARLREVTSQLRHASSESREIPELYSAHDLVSSEQIGQRHRRLAREYDELLLQARKSPGFENFLRPTTVDNLFRAARYGVIVVINCHEDRCDALFVLPDHHSIAHLPLPNFSRTKALSVRSKIDASLKHGGLRERGIRVRREVGGKDEFASALATLWDDVVKPILDFLEYTTDSLRDNLPHITWCPTGAATFLPLHAAGNYDQPRSRIFDYVVSSYTPTITALLASSSSSLDGDSRVLAIGQTETPGHNPLPGTATELNLVRSHVERKAEYTQLIDTQATPSAVLDAMEQHDWVHLACHAYQNIYDPTKSGFFLHGDTEGTQDSLDLASINRRSFNRKGLAFLSACQTATGDETLPDEAVHLASGMLMAGYSSVIATMWSVADEDAPFVADRVYAQLMIDGKLGNGEAGRALHCAVSGLREKVGEKEFARWVPYIHIGS